MSDANLQILTGDRLTSGVHVISPPDFNGVAGTGDRVLQIAEASASECLYGISLPEKLKYCALEKVNFKLKDQKEVDHVEAHKFVLDYLSAVANQLNDDPLVVSVLDGNTIRLFLEDEDDFAMLAENLFTDLDVEDEGKLSKSEIRSALVHMGVEMGVPPLSDFPMVDDILKNHGAEGEEKLGQAQFAQLLQPVLQDLADALALKHATVIHNIKIANGSKLKKVLADKNQLDDIIEKIYRQKCDGQNEQDCTKLIRNYLEKNGKELGLPPLEGHEKGILLYNDIFSDIGNEKRAAEFEKSDFGDLVKQILQKFVVQLQASPVFHDADD